MVYRRYPVLMLLALVGLIALASVLSGCAPVVAAAQSTTPEPAAGRRTLTVLGRGEASAEPDLGTISVGVETFSSSVAEASAQNNTKMAAVMAKLKELGIAAKDIQTSNFSINSERQPGPDGSPRDISYRVSNMVTIKVRDLAKAGPTLDAVIAAGANQVWGVSFTLEDTGKLEAEARSKAIDDARARAEALAKLNGVTLGEVLTISENDAGGASFGAMALGKGADSSAINPGEVQFNSQVQVTFAIK